MKFLTVLVVPILASSLWAQTTGAQNPLSACGAQRARYRLKTTDSKAIPAPDPGMATLVFIEDEIQLRPGHLLCVKCSTRVQLGMDGQWIAATKGFAHTSVSIGPGDHHFCAVGLPAVFGPSPVDSFFSLHAEAGKTYFLRGRLSYFYRSHEDVLDLSRINDDEGRYMVFVTPEIVATRK